MSAAGGAERRRRSRSRRSRRSGGGPRPERGGVRAPARAPSAATRPAPSSASPRRSGPSTAPTSRPRSTCASCRPRARTWSQGPGENAGVVDVGDGWVAAFKMESHNHPSFIEPYQGAATGVGGILRDVFTMGARPMALHGLAPLRRPRRAAHAPPGRRRGARHRRLRQLRRHPDGRRPDRLPPLLRRQHPGQRLRPRRRPARPDLPRRAPPAPATRSSTSAAAPGATASTAPPWRRSRSTTRARPSGPTVQVGDPFTEKMLLEACLEAMRTGAIVAIQDMGAAGPDQLGLRDGRARRHRHRPRPRPRAAARGGPGPVRDHAVGVPGAHAAGRPARTRGGGRAQVFRRWGLEVSPIGEVTAGGRAVLTWHGETVGDLPVLGADREGARCTAGRWRSPPTSRRARRRPEVPEPGDPLGDARAAAATRRTRLARSGSGASTTTRCAPTPCAARGATPRCCCSRAPRRASRWRPTSTRSTATSTRAPAAPRRWPRRCATSPASAPSRWGSPTASTSATRSGPEIMWQFREASRGMTRRLPRPRRAGGLGQRLVLQRDRRQVGPPDADRGGGRADSGPRRAAADSWFVRGRATGSSCSARTGEEFGGSAWLRLAPRHRAGRAAGGRPGRRGAARRAAAHPGLPGHGSHRPRPLGGRAGGGAGRGLLRPRAGGEDQVPLAPAELFSESQARALVACAPEHPRRGCWRRAERRRVPAGEIGEVGGA